MGLSALSFSSYSSLFISLHASSISVASALPTLLTSPDTVIRVDFLFLFKVYFNLLPFNKDHEPLHKEHEHEHENSI